MALAQRDGDRSGAGQDRCEPPLELGQELPVPQVGLGEIHRSGMSQAWHAAIKPQRAVLYKLRLGVREITIGCRPVRMGGGTPSANPLTTGQSPSSDYAEHNCDKLPTPVFEKRGSGL